MSSNEVPGDSTANQTMNQSKDEDSGMKTVRTMAAEAAAKRRQGNQPRDNSGDDDGDSGGSSSEGKSGSGGYSADCSASDQDSDEYNDSKARTKVEDPDIPTLDALDISDVKKGKDSKQDITQHKAGDDGGDSESEDKDGEYSTKKKKKKTKRGSASVERITKRGADKTGSADDETDTYRPMLEDGHRTSSDIGFPLKSPDMIDIEAIMRSKEQQGQENDSFFAGTAFLPQLNGVRIGNPMDPRIDLSVVNVLPQNQHNFFPLGRANNNSTAVAGSTQPSATHLHGQPSIEQQQRKGQAQNTASASGANTELPSIDRSFLHDRWYGHSSFRTGFQWCRRCKIDQLTHKGTRLPTTRLTPLKASPRFLQRLIPASKADHPLTTRPRRHSNQIMRPLETASAESFLMKGHKCCNKKSRLKKRKKRKKRQSLTPRRWWSWLVSNENTRRAKNLTV
mmetsp:Transcript_21802/g.51167  ORF Transcript_21802/g.51167 Transcript_21802/m.51167 type:complete len:452 (-) Transcript_21802:3353-4708(-)